jgi:hypothetical protein
MHGEDDNAGRPSRRHFLRGGAALPVIVTLASRPALAGQCTVSGRLSGNLSVPRTLCDGRDPRFWAVNPALWPGGFAPGRSEPGGPPPTTIRSDEIGQATTFAAATGATAPLVAMQVLDAKGNRQKQMLPMTLMQALWSGDQRLMQYAAAALNATAWPRSYGYDLAAMRGLIARRDGDPAFVRDLTLINRTA